MKIDDYQMNVITDRQAALASEMDGLLKNVKVPSDYIVMVHKGYGYPRVSITRDSRSITVAVRMAPSDMEIMPTIYKESADGDTWDAKFATPSIMLEAIEWLKGN